MKNNKKGRNSKNFNLIQYNYKKKRLRYCSLTISSPFLFDYAEMPKPELTDEKVRTRATGFRAEMLHRAPKLYKNTARGSEEV